MSRDAPPTTFYALRHGRVAESWRGRIYGGLDVPLAPEGERQARAAAARLAGVELSAVVSSGLARAEFGAALLRESRGLERQDDPELAEIDRGEWGGRTFAELEAERPGAWRDWMRTPGTARPPGGESLNDLASRVLPRLDHHAARHPGGSVAIVAHSWVTRLFACEALGLEPARATSLHLAVGDLIAFEWPQGWWSEDPPRGRRPVLLGYALDSLPDPGVRWYRGPRQPG